METFVWDARFDTGIEIVDRQHRHLVKIINQVGDLLLDGNALKDGGLEGIFKELADYARRHFADEEKLMREVGLDERHQQGHAAHHRQFVEQLRSIWRAREALTRPAETVHGFLAAWLTVHILGEDQAMARQVARRHAGETAQAAYEAEKQDVDKSTGALLAALNRLYHVIAQQNLDLAEMNLHLEEKVAVRTRELSLLLKKVEDAQQQLLQSEKLAAIGQLAAGIAHEINNPVGFVHSNLTSLKHYIDQLFSIIDADAASLPSAGAAREAAERARRAADLDFLREDLPALLKESEEGLTRVIRIVRDLKDFAHVDEAQIQPADLNAGMESTLNVVRNELKYKAEIVRDYGDIPPVECMAAQINQVFMNLLVNAAQAIPEHGTITVRSGCEGDEVWVEVRDTGKGMTPEVQKRIFEPFFTTKPVGKGTGLGLSLSYDIVVKKHGGRIEVQSEPGQGSTFRVTLPRMHQPASPAA